MKLCRFGDAGIEKPGLIDVNGQLRDLSSVIQVIGPETLSPQNLSKLASVDSLELPLVPGNPRLGVPFEGVSKIVCIGLNYSDHAL